MRIFRTALVGAFVLGASVETRADDKPTTESGKDEAAQEEAQSEPEESDFSDPPARPIIKRWNQFDFKYLTLKYGIYTIEDFGNAAQTAHSKSVIEVPAAYKIRDFRFSFSGKLATERPISYSAGLMYDGPTNSWFVRETGVQIGFPELWGNIFVGRQKEGISLQRITVGYAVWVMERMPIGDVTIPILTDGAKWLGGTPGHHANWNVGYFINELPKSPATGWYERAFAARLCWVPLRPDKEDRGSLLHLGAGYAWARYADNEATHFQARPESSTAPFFLDAGTFPAQHNNVVDLELYYRHDNVLAGTEYMFNKIHAPEVGNPLFHGGMAFVAWTVTGEIRPYIDLGGKLGFIHPKSSAFQGGTGALEAVLNATYTDLDSGDVDGGKFWRITPQLNWYLDDMVSLRFNYGLGHLDRFGTTAFTNFFQFRLQFQIE